MRKNKYSEECIYDIARNISYGKLLILDENKYEEIFRFTKVYKN